MFSGKDQIPIPGKISSYVRELQEGYKSDATQCEA
jgi:hypothetical protein